MSGRSLKWPKADIQRYLEAKVGLDSVRNCHQMMATDCDNTIVCSTSSKLQLALQLVHEAPVRPLCDKLLRHGPDHIHLAQA
jgi:hypothetical protein